MMAESGKSSRLSTAPDFIEQIVVLSNFQNWDESIELRLAGSTGAIYTSFLHGALLYIYYIEQHIYVKKHSSNPSTHEIP